MMIKVLSRFAKNLGYEIKSIHSKPKNDTNVREQVGPFLDHESMVNVFHHASTDQQSERIKAKFINKIKDNHYQLQAFACPICKHNHFTDVAVSELGFKWGICCGCGLLQQYLRLTDDHINAFYQSGEYQAIIMANLDDKTHFQLEKEVNSLCFIDIFEKLKLPLHNKNILEIGCGSGGILLSLKKMGANVFGYDIDEYRINQGRKALPMLEVGDALSEEMVLPESLDFVILSNILEHLSLPHIFLSKLRSKLMTSSRAARLLIDVPNLETAASYSNESFLPFLHIAHLWYFNAITIERLLNQCGFYIEYIFSRDSSFSIVASISEQIIENNNNAYMNTISSINYANYKTDRHNLQSKIDKKLADIFRG